MNFFIPALFLLAHSFCEAMELKERPLFFQLQEDAPRQNRDAQRVVFPVSSSWLTHSTKIREFSRKRPTRGRDQSTAIVVPLNEAQCRMLEDCFCYCSHDEQFRTLFFSNKSLPELTQLLSCAKTMNVVDLKKPLARAVCKRILEDDSHLQRMLEHSNYLTQSGLTEGLCHVIAPFVLTHKETEKLRKLLFSSKPVEALRAKRDETGIAKDQLSQIEELTGTISQLAIVDNCAVLLNQKGTVFVLELSSDQPELLVQHETAYRPLRVESHGRYVAFASLNGGVIINMLGLLENELHLNSQAPLLAGSFHPHEPLFAALTDSQEIRLWNSETGAPTARIALDRICGTLSFAPDGATIFLTPHESSFFRCCHYTDAALRESLGLCTFEQKLLLRLLLQEREQPGNHTYYPPELQAISSDEEESRFSTMLALPHAQTIIASLDTRIVDTLLLRGSHLEPKENGSFYIHEAARKGDIQAVAYLLKHGCPFDLRDSRGATALHEAAGAGQAECVEFLLTAGADQSLLDEKGETALDRAVNAEQLSAEQPLAEQPLADKPLADKHATVQNLLKSQMRKAGYHEGSTLHYAAMKGYTNAVTYLLKFEPCDALDSAGFSPLHRAVQAGQYEVAQLVVYLKALINTTNADVQGRETPLHTAVQQGSQPLVTLLLENGANVSGRNRWGETALYQAAACGHAELVTLLLTHSNRLYMEKKLVHQAAGNGQTPLHAAAHAGHLAVVILLCEHGADVNALSKKNETPLHLAARVTTYDVETTLKEFELCEQRVSLSSGSNVTNLDAGNLDSRNLDSRNLDSRNLDSRNLDFIKRWEERRAEKAQVEKKYVVIAELLARKADPNLQNQLELTPLDAAVEHNFLELAKLLLANGARLDCPDSCGRTALFRAAMKGRTAFIELFIQNGASVHGVDKLGNGLLHYAAEHGHNELVTVLLQQGASLSVLNNQHQPAAHVALLHDHKELAGILLLKEIEHLECADESWTPAHCACYCGYTELVAYMLLQPRTALLITEQQWTLLHAAALSDSPETIKLLVDAGLSCKSRTADGATALHIAAKCGSLKALKALILAEAQVDAQDDEGDMPLQYAQREGHSEVVAFLRNLQ